MAIDPLQDVPHGELLRRGGMEQGREQRASTFGPVMLAGALPAEPAGADHRVGRHDCRIPITSSRQRRPTDALDARWAFHLAARVVEERPTFDAPRRCSRPHDVGLGRGRDDRSVREQNIGYDQGRCLPGPRRSQHQCRALRAGPPPSVGAFTNIDAVARQTVDLAQCCTRNQARISVVDMRMSVVFHSRDVCVWERTNPWDISLKATTTTPQGRRADAGCDSFARAEQSETKVVEECKMTPRRKNA